MKTYNSKSQLEIHKNYKNYLTIILKKSFLGRTVCPAWKSKIQFPRRHLWTKYKYRKLFIIK